MAQVLFTSHMEVLLTHSDVSRPNCYYMILTETATCETIDSPEVGAILKTISTEHS